MPALVSAAAATVDLLTDGRLELGLGAGYVKSEYERAACARRPRRSANVDCLSPHNLKVVGANPTAQPIVEHEFRSRVSSPRTELAWRLPCSPTAWPTPGSFAPA